MSTFSDKAFHDNDYVRVMASISEHVATTLDANVADQQEAGAKAEAQIQALLDAGFTPPGDLSAKTDALIQVVRDSYQASVDQSSERLALPAAVREALGVPDERLEALKATAQQWLLSIDAMWSPGGGN